MNWLLKLSQFNTYYHGTNNQFDVSEFKSENNSVQNFGLLGLIDVTRYGIFLSDSRDFAKEFGANVMKVKVNVKSTADAIGEKHEFLSSIDPFGPDRKKHEWKCPNGHVWLAEPENIKLVSLVYNGSHMKHRWECNKGNTWEATAKDIQAGSWCPNCANNRKYSVERVKKMMLDRNFELLSKKYLGMSKIHLFRCVMCEHIWETKPNNIQQGRDCPNCKRKGG